MDKNKDFIRLDEAFQSLGQGEAPYQPGAWANMKALLDEEMPLTTGVASRSPLMRYLIPLLALLLAGTGFYFWQNNRQTHLAATTGTSSGSAGASGLFSHDNNHVLQQEPPQHQAEFLTTANESTQDKLNSAEQPAGALPSQNSSSSIASGSDPIASISNSGEEVKGNIDESTPVLGHTNQELVAFSEESDEVWRQPTQNVSEIALVKSIGNVNRMPENIEFFAQTKNNIPTDIIALQQSLPSLEKEQVLQQWKPELQSPLKESDVAKELVVSNRLEKVTYEGTQPVYRAENGGLYKEQRDTFKRLELARKLPANYLRNENKPVKPILDTVSFKRVAKVSFVPLTYAEIKAYHLLPKVESAQLIPDSRITGSASTEAAAVDMVPLTHYKVSSRKMNASAISRLIHSANSGLAGLMDGSKDWYISLMLGGNTGLGSPNAYGMQIGANFLYAIAERWTISLGASYQSSFYPSFRFWDSAISYGNMHENQTSNGTIFSGTEYQEQTAVSASSLARISVPILLSYNLGRVSVFGGPEFSYFFPLQNETTSSIQSNSVSKLAYDNKNPFSNVPYRLNPQSDFRFRFAAGYALGLSYDFSRKLSFDIRLSQMLWDNTGKYQLDALRNIYHQPTVELNLGFFLGRKEKVIYIMDRNH